MKRHSIFTFKKLTAIFLFMLCTSIISCIAQIKSNIDFSAESFRFEKMDTTSINPSLELQKQKLNSLAYEDINMVHRFLLSSVPKEIIIRRKIQTLINTGSNKEEYDSSGFLIYEKYDAWKYGPNYHYHFNEKGRPEYFTKYNDADTTWYAYDKEMKLIKCGSWIIKYYPNGFKRSVETSAEIERYEYDLKGNICHIKFDIKPGTMACGNRTSEWFGKYDKDHHLVKDLRIGFPASTLGVHKYSKTGDIIQSIYYNEFRNSSSITDYIYKDNTLEIKTRESN